MASKQTLVPPADAPYRDAALSTAGRVEDLLARMTLDEKLAQLVGLWVSADADAGEVAPFQAEFFGAGGKLDLDAALTHGLGQVTRPLGSRPVDPADGARVLNNLQRRMLDQTRLGIPVIAHEECLTGYMAKGATGFPSPLNYGATWDAGLVERVADVIRRQMRAVGTHVGLAPVADVIRDARWGRVEECIAEDPYLVGTLLTGYVRGLQGDDLRTGVAATLKHFVGYSGSEGGRNFAPTHVGPRELADVYLIPFEMAIKDGGCNGVMNAYHDNDGVPCTASHELLTETLRHRWGFDGVVVSDYFSVAFLQLLHGTAADKVESAAQALSAGLDVELPSPDCYPLLGEAIERGLLDESVVDTAVRRVLTQKFRLGLFEQPFVDDLPDTLETDADRALVREVADKSIVLLTNGAPAGSDRALLPLDPTTPRVAVIGPNAHEPMALFGNYSFQNHVAAHFPHLDIGALPVSVLDAIAAVTTGEVTYARGCEIMSDDPSGIAEAVAVADAADVAIVVVGDKAGHFGMGTVGEGTDRDDLRLPGAQQALVDAVAATGTPMVVVLVNGRPFALQDVVAAADAVVEAWFPGQEGGHAIADILFGAVNPSGRTTVTFTTGAGQMPRFYNHKTLSPGIPGFSFTPPVFPFGHGLSYTTFAYDDLVVEADAVPVDGVVRASCTVTNTGDRPGDEVVQCYVRDVVGSLPRPVRELKGFARISLAAGASARVAFDLPCDLFSFTGIDLTRIVEPGEVEVSIGRSSADLPLVATVVLTGDVRTVGEDRALSSVVTVSPR